MRVTPPLTGHLDMAISNFIKGYRQPEQSMLQDFLFPRLPVIRSNDRYWVYGKENLQLTEKTGRAFGTSPQEARFTVSNDSYSCKSNALKATIADEDRDNYTIGDLNRDTAQLLQDKNLLSREVRVKNIVTNSAIYPAGNTLALGAAAQWDNFATSDPVMDVKRAARQVKRTGQKPNLFTCSGDVFDALSVNPNLRKDVRFAQVTGPLNEQQVATALGIEKVVVGDAIYNDGSDENSFLWSNFAMLLYCPQGVSAPAGVLSGTGAEGSIGPKDLSFGKSFTWTTAPSTVDGYGVMVSRHPDATAKSDVVGVDWYTDEKVTGADCGFLFTTPLATPSN